MRIENFQCKIYIIACVYIRLQFTHGIDIQQGDSARKPTNRTLVVTCREKVGECARACIMHQIIYNMCF